MFSIPQLVETIKKNFDAEADRILVMFNHDHILNVKYKNYSMRYIRPMRILTRNCKDINIPDIKLIKWTYNPHKRITYTNFSANYFYMYIDTKQRTYKGNIYYEHDESPIDTIDRDYTPNELEAINKHKNDTRIQKQDIINALDDW